MPPASKKRTSSSGSQDIIPYNLTQEQRDALDLLPNILNPALKPLLPLLETIRTATLDEANVVPPHKRSLPTKQATEFETVTEAASMLSIDFEHDNAGYYFELKGEEEEVLLKPHIARTINDIKTSTYVKARRDESFCRTVLDLILLDRLEHLEDEGAHRLLHLSAEIPVSIKAKDTYGQDTMLKGRADWALGYSNERANTSAFLLVVEAKPFGSAPVGMPQLLVYMAAVQKARENRENKSVFGMLSDSRTYTFAFLNQHKKLFITQSLEWALHKNTIIRCIDTMLRDAIESSPHTTPQKTSNRTLHRYDTYLKQQWRFGLKRGTDEPEPEDFSAEMEEDEDEADDVYDIVEIDGRVRVQRMDRS